MSTDRPTRPMPPASDAELAAERMHANASEQLRQAMKNYNETKYFLQLIKGHSRG
jgi:hypothetical protein